MRKLKLDPEALRVEAFSPSGEVRGGAGTVCGHASYPLGCFPPSDSDPALESCGYATCAGMTCSRSCNGYTCGCAPAASAECLSGPTNCLGKVSCLQMCD